MGPRLGAALLALAAAQPSLAAESLLGRAELHGYAELQLRGIVRDFEFSDGFDLTQWANVLDLELELDLAPRGWGPFDSAFLFGRVEVRYECVWSGGCGIFSSADAYGDEIGRLPGRLIDARRPPYVGRSYTGAQPHWYEPVPGSRKPLDFRQTPLGAPFAVGGFGVPLYFRELLQSHCDEWGARARSHGSLNGTGPGQTLLLDPSCDVDAIGAAADRPNPFRQSDWDTALYDLDSRPLPYRPVPGLSPGSRGSREQARGVYYPNARLRELLDDGDLEALPLELRESRLEWNHGAWQEDQRELRELYLDLEAFGRHLWLRAGYQLVVWGKTELLRQQDRVNPQDLALASLPSLEESRIPLWALRATWSFYEVGPLRDVRLEGVLLLDSWEPDDVGTCGEPYTVLAACALSVDSIAHGYTGAGLAGIARPPDPWRDVRGLEVGSRLEFRWDRFSFAITDFYGYRDTPYVDEVFHYSRNVDPETGRPRRGTTSARCAESGGPGCLTPGDALAEHSANQQLFALACGATLGIVAGAELTACLSNLTGSTARTSLPGPAPRLLVALNVIASGDLGGVLVPFLGGFDAGTRRAIQRETWDGSTRLTSFLRRDPGDSSLRYPSGHPLLREPDFAFSVDVWYRTFGGAPSPFLSDAQEALLGCGPLYRSSCELDGIDLLNAEASALFESWPGLDGSFDPEHPAEAWDTTDRSRAQPGTVGFAGAPLCTRVERGAVFELPGCRGPGEPGYDPRVDGTTDGLRHPFTGQRFRSELSALSWNLLMGFTALSGVGEGRFDFDPGDPFRRGACSLREPQSCSAVATFLSLTGVQRNSLRAGGNGAFGRRDFVWHSGGTGVLRVDRSNVLGFAMDFPEPRTGASFAFEASWTAGVHLGDFDSASGNSEVDLYALAVAVERPTFVRFLNAERTFQLRTEWFVEYAAGWRRGFARSRALEAAGVVAVSTGYFRDRLLPTLALVYWVSNASFGVVPQVTWRLSDSLSATVGLAAFSGREESRPMPLAGTSPATERFGHHAYRTSVENGLSLIRERDELFLRLRYTF